MSARYTLRQKKDFLIKFDKMEVTLSKFCDQEGLLKGTFSKWLKKKRAILLTPDSCVTVTRKVVEDSKKKQLVEWIQERLVQGFQVDVISLRAYAQSNVPSIFKTSTSYNSEYVLCRRLLGHVKLHQVRAQLEDTSASLLSLATASGPAIDVSRLYEHGSCHRFKNCSQKDVEIPIDYGTCNCKGKCTNQTSITRQ